MRLYRYHPVYGLSEIPSPFFDWCKKCYCLWTERKNNSFSKLLAWLTNTIVEIYLGWPSIQFFPSLLIISKNITASFIFRKILLPVAEAFLPCLSKFKLVDRFSNISRNVSWANIYQIPSNHFDFFFAPLAESQSSLCHGELSVVHQCARQSSPWNHFASLTTWSIWIKLHRKHPLNVPS